MSKKRKALQVTALLSAVSGATMIVTAGTTPVSAGESRVEERCWDQEPFAPTTQYRLHGCTYNQYGLTPAPTGNGSNNGGYTPAEPGTGGGGGGPSGGGGYTS